MKRAVIYARVSTEEQADKGYSLESQLEAMRRYAAVHGFTVTAEVKEEHSGAVAFGERPRGREVTAMLKRREATVIIAYQVDRLSRDIVDLLVICREWLRADVEIHVCEIGKVESESGILLVLRGWQGTDERKKIAERVNRGRWLKARSGKVVGCGRSPYGYRYMDGELIIEESEARVVRMIFDWYTKSDGNSRPLSGTAIAKRLNELRISPPGVVRGWTRKRKDNPKWEITSTIQILSRETYSGIWRYGKRIGRGGVNGARDLDETVVVKVPAIIPRELWERAQWQREQNKILSPRNNKKNEYLMRSLIFCGCGRRMTGYTIDGHVYYRCNRKASHIPEERTCKDKYQRGDRIEFATWEFVLEVLTADRAKFESWLREAQELERRTKAPQRQHLEDVIAMIAECEAEAEKVALALREAKGIVSRALERQQFEVNEKHTALIAKREWLNGELTTDAFTDSDVESALQFRDDVEVGMQNPTFADKRKALELLRVTATAKGDELTLKCLLPIPPKVIELKTLYSDTGSTPLSSPTYHSHPPRSRRCWRLTR